MPAALDVSPPTTVAPVMDAAEARRKLASLTLPVLSPRLLTQLTPTRIASRFDVDAALEAALQEPALALGLYAEVRRGGGGGEGEDDPHRLIAAAGAEGLSRVISRLRLVSPPTEPGVRMWLDAGCRHALAVSRLAGMLAPAANVEPRIAAVAGLLHDAGRLALLSAGTGEAALAAYEFARGAGLSNVYVERSMVGVSHKQAGVELCRRVGVPQRIAAVCDTHDFTDAQRSRLEPAAGGLAALVALCDALANSAGLTGDPAPQLRHVPAQLESLIAEHAADIEGVLAQVRIDAETRWPLCRDAQDSDEVPTCDGGDEGEISDDHPLRGVRVALVAQRTLWHPMRQPMEAAGATVTLAPPPVQGDVDADVIVLDASADALASIMADAAPGAAPATPRLVLAQRCHEPYERMWEAGLSCAVVATPIRPQALIGALVRLTAHSSRPPAPAPS